MNDIKAYGWCLLALFGIGGCFWLMGSEEREGDPPYTKARQTSLSAEQDFAQRYDLDTTWGDFAITADFTASFQDRIESLSGRPVLISGLLLDISRRDSTYEIMLGDDGVFLSVVYRLTCPEDEGARLVESFGAWNGLTLGAVLEAAAPGVIYRADKDSDESLGTTVQLQDEALTVIRGRCVAILRDVRAQTMPEQ